MQNMLQAYFLELMNYATDVSKNLYARCYFHLRHIGLSYRQHLLSYPLDRKRAWDLQALSRMEQDEVFCKGMTRSVSADDLTSLRHAKAVLS
ncbi:hypothetical protein P7K49_014287 [Saguinus oedipus]|uniref:Uncharacterized protein n=1 Tax=Saguinus oedipus TaxID=9490 RepID=A0ABQ9VIR5_SAGOE|nr:hypothetical protein P7K49_014287 [Saguinus oedipus]